MGLKTKENIHMFQEISSQEDIVVDINFYGARKEEDERESRRVSLQTYSS